MTRAEDVPEDGSLARCLGYQIDECPWGQDTDERTIWIREFLSIGMFLKREGERRISRVQAWAWRESSIGRAAPVATNEALLASMAFDLD